MYSITKPTTPTLDKDNSISSGLVFDAEFHEELGATTSDLVGSTSGAISASGATWENSTYGVDLDFSAVASSVVYTSPSSINTLTQFSYEALWFCRSIGGGSLGRLFQKGNTANGTPFYFMVDTITVSSLEINAAQQTTSGQWTWPFSFNTWYHMVITYDTTLTNAPVLYINGVSQSLSVVTAPTGTYFPDDTTLTIGNTVGATRNFNGKISYLRIWNRILSSTEALKLAQNPWRIMAADNLGNNYKYGKVGDGMGRSESWT